MYTGLSTLQIRWSTKFTLDFIFPAENLVCVSGRQTLIMVIFLEASFCLRIVMLCGFHGANIFRQISSNYRVKVEQMTDLNVAHVK